MTTEELIELIAASAYVAHGLALSGHQTPRQASYWTRMGHPQAGDLVVEVTNWNAPAIDRLGRLESVKDEEPDGKEEYDEESWGRPWPPYLEKTWRIVTIDDRKMKWTNANFIVVPEHPFRHQAYIGP